MVRGIDDVDEHTTRPVLHHNHRNNQHTTTHVEQKTRLHELIRPKLALTIQQLRLQTKRRDLLIDLVVDDRERSRAEQRAAITAIGFDTRLASLPHLIHAHKIILQKREDDRDRIELHKDDNAVRIDRINDVARIDETDTNNAIDRQLDVRVVHVKHNHNNLHLINLHHNLHQLNNNTIVVDLLLQNKPFLVERNIAAKRRLRIELVRMVLGAHRDGLRLLHLERPRIDERDLDAFLHVLPFDERNLHERTVDLRVHDDHL